MSTAGVVDSAGQTSPGRCSAASPPDRRFRGVSQLRGGSIHQPGAQLVEEPETLLEAVRWCAGILEAKKALREGPRKPLQPR
jgi:hypothetical protein